MSKRPSHAFRPQHPFPCLVSGTSFSAPVKLSSTHRQILYWIKKGARVLFDIRAKRAMIYTFDQGFKTLSEITVRCLSTLLKSGHLAFMAKQDHLVHYARVGCSPVWYLPE